MKNKELKIKIMPIDTGREHRILLNPDSEIVKKEGFVATSKVKVNSKKKHIYGILYMSKKLKKTK